MFFTCFAKLGYNLPSASHQQLTTNTPQTCLSFHIFLWASQVLLSLMVLWRAQRSDYQLCSKLASYSFPWTSFRINWYLVYMIAPSIGFLISDWLTYYRWRFLLVFLICVVIPLSNSWTILLDMHELMLLCTLLHNLWWCYYVICFTLVGDGWLFLWLS